MEGWHVLPSLKLTAKAPENGWLEYSFPFGARPIFRGELLVSGRVLLSIDPNSSIPRPFHLIIEGHHNL